jgi:signal transduction histidine kinase
MTPRPLRVLVVEDNEDDVQLLLRELRRGGFEPRHERVETAEQMRAAFEDREWEIVICDYSMPGFTAREALEIVKQRRPEVPFIILSGSITEDDAVAALRAGAHDFVVKGNLARLLPAVERELREAETRRDRAQLEEQFRQAQKMEAVGRLAGGIAHDFNNLLTVIAGYAQLALESVPASEPLAGHLAEVKKAADRASELTRQLLAFSRRQVLTVQVTNLNAIVAGMEKMLRRLIGEDIDLETRLAPDLASVRTDPGQIEQIIMNLAVNARDAMPAGGKLTLETRNVELDASYASSHATVVPGPYVLLAVSDTGVGMDDELLSHIFEPFFTTKEQGKGTGLGLAMVYGTVKQSSGYIWAYSAKGKGTTFKIYLPRAEKTEEEAGERRAEEHPPSGAETILLVEDEAGVRGLAQRVLEQYGYRVLVAQHGEEALRLLGKHDGPIHLLVTDVVMPGISGRELAEALRLSKPDLKVLYMSGYTDEAIVRHGVLEEGVQFLQKPFTPQGLAHKVRQVLDAG